ncbi:MAG: type II CRISPR RNA-guided endonuclease Cas9 [bacterium]
MSKQKYFIGLDPGSASVGYAVTDENYNLIKTKGKHFWGIRLFEAGETAQQRRVDRGSRNNLERKKQRIILLQEIFNEEVNSIDNGFFLRLKESMYHKEDKSTNQKYSLFNDGNYSDIDYYHDFKTIYHLKEQLIKGDIKDPRLLYLALSHSLKHRGHFIFQDESISKEGNLNDLITSLNTYILENEFCLKEGINDNFDCDVLSLEKILKNKRLSMSSKEKEIKTLFDNKNSKRDLLIKMMVGGKVDIVKLFDIETDKIKSFGFKANFDETYTDLEDVLGDYIELVDIIKAIYDWVRLADIIGHNDYICQAKVDSYRKHHEDIKLLKEFIKKYCPEKYKTIFSLNIKGEHNYVSYIYLNKVNNKKQVIDKKCSQEDFCKYVLKLIEKYKENVEEKYLELYTRLELIDFAPKQLVNSNCVVPYQITLTEMKAILNNCEKNFPFLNSIDKDGYKTKDKILSLLTFRVPYYVGHINNYHSNSWIVKAKQEKVRPWNYKEVIDIEKSAENFIRRMTNKCTYLKEEDVIPKDSLLYSKFMVLNEINNIKVNGIDISIDMKKEIYNNLFCKQKKVTPNQIKSLIKSTNSYTKEITITGIDITIKSSLKSYIELNQIIPNVEDNVKESIINKIVLFSADKKLLKSILSNEFDFKEEVINKLSKLNYKDWARFSNKFLTQLTDVNKETGEVLNIINMMYETNNNLMQLLSNEYNYIKQINDMNTISTNITLDTIENLYCSPAVRKSIWQTFQIVEEIVKVMGGKPEKIFVEMAREEGEKVRTESRKTALLSLYSSIKKEEPIIYDRLNNSDEKSLRSKKLYLYYTQMGRCAYTNQVIQFESLFNDNIYDIEHIYPRSKSMDDSIINNLVLVNKIVNSNKSDQFPIPTQYRQLDLWKKLLELKLITQEKFNRLSRVTEFTETELKGFIQRQLVETRQSTKIITELLTNYLSDSKGKVVYSKAGNVSRFRQHFDITKNRDLNDLHHAHDAYLNIVVGNVFDCKFNEKFYLNITSNSYSLKPDILYNSKYAQNNSWNDNTIGIVKDNIFNKRVLFTRQAFTSTGQLFNLNPVKKNTGSNKGIPLKDNAILIDVTKYGSYIGKNPSYFTLVEYLKGKKSIRTLISIPTYISNMTINNKEIFNKYIKDELGITDYNIIINKIKLNSLVSIEGMIVHLSGGKDVKNAIQLILAQEQSDYLKKLYKLSNDSNIKDASINEINNYNLYNIMLDKLNNNIYSKFKSYKSAIVAMQNKDKFITLTILQQVNLLKEIMKLFSCSAARANLKSIDGPSEAGRESINLNISSYNKFELINQSITGIYENRIDLLTCEKEK